MTDAEGPQPAPEGAPAGAGPGALWRRRAPCIALLPASFLALALAARAPGAVESLYARGLFPWIAEGLRLLFGWLPCSAAEGFLVGAFVATPFALARFLAPLLQGRRPVRPALHGLAANALAALGVGAASFVLLWGLSYHRLPLAVTLHGAEAGAPPTAAEVAALASELVGAANALRVGWEPMAVEAVLAEAPLGYAAAGLPFLEGFAGRAKPVACARALAALGTGGIYCPWTGEANVNPTLPAPLLPFVTCHEMAHQRGFAREDEANYLGWRACRDHPRQAFRYSARFAMARYAIAAVAQTDLEGAKALAARRSPAVARDIQAVRDWYRRQESPLAMLAEAANDLYLRANAQGGRASYGRVVSLLVAERRAPQ